MVSPFPQKFSTSHGFTLVEILMVLALVGILSSASITMIGAISDDASYDKTFGRMQLIRTALIGDLDTTKQGLREYYGYLGDVGSLPTATTHQGLTALISQPAGVSVFAINSTAKVGMGWRGPYLKATVGVNWLKDAWGRDIIYSATTNPPYIESLGADGVALGDGPNEDIRFNLGPEFTTATIHGVINENGVPLGVDAVVELYQPDGDGALETRSVTLVPTDNGYFSFSNVPFGQRALKVSFPDTSSPVDVIGPIMISVDNSNYTIAHNFLDRTPGALPHACDDPDALASYEVVGASSLRLLGNGTDATNSAPSSLGASLSRFYFEINIKKSISVDDIFIQFNDNDVDFEGITIGNESRYCRYHPLYTSTDYFTCYDYNVSWFSLFGLDPEIEDTCDKARFILGPGCAVTAPPSASMIISDIGYNTNPALFPQINLNRSWVIQASDPNPAAPPDGVGFTPNYGKRVGVSIHARGASFADISNVTSINLRLGCKMSVIGFN